MEEERSGSEASGIQVRGSLEATAVGAVLLFVARHTFSASYFLSLGLSPDFRLLPPDSSFWPVALLAVTAIVVIATGRFLERWSDRSFGGMGVAVVGTLVIGLAALFVWLTMGASLGTPLWARTTVASLMVIPSLFAFWVAPVYREVGKKGYWRKVAHAFRPRATPPSPSMPVPTSALRRALSLGRPVTWIPISVACTIILSAWYGHFVAANQLDWIEVDSGGPHSSVHRVVFTSTDGSLWTADLADDGTLSPELRRLDGGACTLRPLPMQNPARVRRVAVKPRGQVAAGASP